MRTPGHPLAALLLLLTASTSSSAALDHGPPGQATTVARLPPGVIPVHYDLSLAPYFEPEGDIQALDVEGEVVIDLTVAEEPTDTITLHSAVSLIDFDNVGVYQLDNGNDDNIADPTGSSNENETLTIALTKEVSGNLTVLIPFRGQLATDMDGLYLSTYQSGNNTKYMASTQFAPMSARKAFPCFDEPALKATFQVTVYPPKGYAVLSNTEQEDGDSVTTTPPPPEELSDSRTTYSTSHGRLVPAADRAAVKFKKTRRMSTYLVAVVVYDPATFSALERPATSTEGPQRVWSRDDLAGQRSVALDVGAAALESYGRLFPDFFQYMVDKLDQVAIPDFYFGAMENWGLVTYRERALLIDEAESSTSARRYAVTTMSHELAHQWFGDLVTPDFWNVLWLKEGFATYWAYHVDLGDLTAGWQLKLQFLVEQLALSLDADAREETHPLTSDPDTAALYDDISYSKGASIIRMFSYWIGVEEFYKGLNVYLNNRMYDSALQEDLFEAIVPDGNTTITSYMDIWTTMPGYPVVSVTRDGTKATLTQVRYLLTPSENATFSAPWPIPVTYTVGTNFGENATRTVWLIGEEEAAIDGLEESQPLYLNLNWEGFYRVNYDSNGWTQIGRQLSSDYRAVPNVTRSQLVCDAFSLARSGHLDYQVALDLSMYLQQERDYLPWGTAFRAFDFLDTVLVTSGHYDSFKNYVKYLLGQLASDVTYTSRADDDHVTRQLRAGISKWMCRASDATCLQTALDLISSSATASTNSIDPDLRAAVYCVWAQDGDLWDDLWNHYLETTVATEKLEVLSALGCSQNVTTLNTYLQLVLDPTKIRPQDHQTVFTGVSSTPLGLEVAIDFISNNADNLTAQSRYLEKIITGIANKVTTDDQLEKLKTLSNVEALKSISGTIESASSTAAKQVKWTSDHVGEIITWLESGNIPTSSSSPQKVSHLIIIASVITSFFFISSF